MTLSEAVDLIDQAAKQLEFECNPLAQKLQELADQLSPICPCPCCGGSGKRPKLSDRRSS